MLKEGEIQLSQQLSGLTNQLAALQTEKEDLIQQCNAKESEIKAFNNEIGVLKEKVRITEESEEKSKKTVEELEVSCNFFFFWQKKLIPRVWLDFWMAAQFSNNFGIF